MNTQGNNVAPPPPTAGTARIPGAAARIPADRPDRRPRTAPIVTVRSDHPRARLQVQGPLKWQDVCVAPCNVPVNPQGMYRIGGGTIRPSEGFNMPRPAGQVVVEAQTGSTVKHWVGFGLTIGGAVAAAQRRAALRERSEPDIYGKHQRRATPRTSAASSTSSSA